MTVRVDSEIQRLSQVLDQRVDEYGELAVRAAECEAAYRIAYAKVYLGTEGTVSAREQTAVVACADQLTERLLAEGIRDSCQESMRSIRAQLSALQTLAANERAALSVA